MFTLWVTPFSVESMLKIEKAGKCIVAVGCLWITYSSEYPVDGVISWEGK